MNSSGSGDHLGGEAGGPGELDFLFGTDGPFRLPATSEEFFGSAGRRQEAEVRE